MTEALLAPSGSSHKRTCMGNASEMAGREFFQAHGGAHILAPASADTGSLAVMKLKEGKQAQMQKQAYRLSSSVPPPPGPNPPTHPPTRPPPPPPPARPPHSTGRPAEALVTTRLVILLVSRTCPSAAHVTILLPPLWGIMRAWNTLLLCPLLKVRRGVPASNTCSSSHDDWKGVGGWKHLAVLRNGHHWPPGKQCAHTMGSTPQKHQMQDLLGLSTTATTLASRWPHVFLATCLFGQLAWNFRSLLTLLHRNWQKKVPAQPPALHTHLFPSPTA